MAYLTARNGGLIVATRVFAYSYSRWAWDDVARTVTEVDGQGVPIGPTRSWTVEEQAAWDRQVLADTEEANRRTIEDKLDAAMADVQALLDTANATINSGPAPYIKTLARVARLLIRLVRRKLDGTA